MPPSGQPSKASAAALNRAVCGHLEGKSAHSDVAGALLAAVKPLGDVQLHCADWPQCRCVAVSTKQIVFGFALGMNLIAFRLDERMRSRALASGAAAYPECGDDWVAFILFRDDWPKVDVDFWALKAYVGARETVQ